MVLTTFRSPFSLAFLATSSVTAVVFDEAMSSFVKIVLCASSAT